MAALEKLPDYRDIVVFVGTTVRKPLPILKAYLDSLAWQDTQKQVRLVPIFVPDFTPEQADAQEYLFKWVNEHGGVLLQGVPSQQGDFSDAPQFMSHQWQTTSMARVGQNKNAIIRHALANNADYLWFADADLICDRTTLASMLSCDKPVVTATYWTRWSSSVPETARNDAGPQVWNTHPYNMDGHGMDAAEFRGKLVDRSLTRVWGFGACTLINRKVLEAGITFDFLPDVPMEGLMAGEDRHFCIRCERQHVEAYADNWPDIFHVYHAATDIAKIPAMVERLGAAHPDRLQYGDLFSARFRALEPLPVSPTHVQHVAPQYVRGRLGGAPLLPQLETALGGLSRGQSAVVRMDFPIHWPVAVLRGRSRLIEVTLIDAKPNCHPPILEEDFKHGIDVTTLTPRQLARQHG